MYVGAEGRQYRIKAIVNQLNAEGVCFRGKPFTISKVHRILTQESYAGSHWFNVKEAKTGKVRPRSDWVAMEVPPIVERGRSRSSIPGGPQSQEDTAPCCDGAYPSDRRGSVRCLWLRHDAQDGQVQSVSLLRLCGSCTEGADEVRGLCGSYGWIG